MNPVHFSSESAEWATPQELFDKLNAEFGPFLIDVCATAKNAKCSEFFSKEQNGLAQRWCGKCFMNPVYGDSEQPCRSECKKKRCAKRGFHVSFYEPGIADWVAKAVVEARCGVFIVALLPARTDTRWWQNHIQREGAPPYPWVKHIRFLGGRLRFVNPNKPKAATAPFPSAVVVFSQPSAQPQQQAA